MTFYSTFFSWIFLISLVYCSFSTQPSENLDRLMVYGRFREAKKLLAAAEDDLDQFCTGQVLTRCVDLRNYKARQRSSSSNNNNLSEDGSTVYDQDSIIQEANDILDTLLPVAIHKKSVITRAFNAAVFHSDYQLMKRFGEMNQNLFASDDDGLTPLMTAIKFHRRGPFQWLLLNDADINYVNYRGENLVHILARTVSNDRIINSFVVNLIREEGLNWKLENNVGFTPMDIAEAKENYEIVDLLFMIDKEQE